MDAAESIKKLSKLVTESSDHCRICRDITIEVINENTSFYARCHALETLVFAQDRLLSALNTLSCATIEELNRLLQEQTSISQTLLAKQRENMSLVKETVLRNRLQTLIMNGYPFEQVISESEKFFPDEINVINKGNNHEIWIVYDDSRPRVHLINFPITQKAKNV